MMATPAVKIRTGAPFPSAPDVIRQAGMCLVDYLQLVIASLRSEHGFSEDEAVELTFNLSAVLCISDAQWQGYTPDASAGAVVVQSLGHHRLS